MHPDFEQFPMSTPGETRRPKRRERVYNSARFHDSITTGAVKRLEDIAPLETHSEWKTTTIGSVPHTRTTKTSGIPFRKRIGLTCERINRDISFTTHSCTQTSLMLSNGLSSCTKMHFHGDSPGGPRGSSGIWARTSWHPQRCRR